MPAHVSPATAADGTSAVLKRGRPEEAAAEAEALRLAGGRGMVRLLAFDAEHATLLLERAEPGTPLAELVHAGEDDAATGIAVAVMRELWRPAPEAHGLPTVADWGRGFVRHRAACDGGSGPLDAGLLARAEATFAALVVTAAEPVVLHGDLHHENILRARREPWLAIDPKGVVGEPAYEPGALLRNPYPRLPSAAMTRRRLDRLAADLELDRERLREWAFAQAVLSAVWHLEDGTDGWEYAVACAELLAAG